MSVYEHEDELGYYEWLEGTGTRGSAEQSEEACPDREVGGFDPTLFYEACPECEGRGFWRDPEHGPQPCLNCIETPGVVPHACPSREGIEGAG